jgi:hypothetical protein
VLTATRCGRMLGLIRGSLCGHFRLQNTATRRTLSPQGAVDHRSSAAYAGLNRDRLHRAIDGTGATLHAGIAVVQLHLPVAEAENRMRTDEGAHAAAYTFLRVQIEGDHIFEIDESTHSSRS